MNPAIDNNLKRQKKIAEWETRIQLLHKKYPRLEEIARLFSQFALELVMVEMGSGKMGMTKEELIKAKEALQMEKKSIILANRLPPNIYDIWWDCEKCKDTGFVKAGVKCECRLKEEMQARWQASGLSPEQEKQTFANFSLEWYEDKERYRNILEKALAFTENVIKGDKTDNLLFHGPVGTGKTHLCSAIANHVLQAGISVVYLKTGILLDLIRNAKFDPEKGTSYIESLYRVGLLILDDLGTENLTDFAKEQIFLLLDMRLNYHLPWVISTNLSPNALDAHYELRFIDRIMGTSQVLKFTGESIRQKKKLNKSNG